MRLGSVSPDGSRSWARTLSVVVRRPSPGRGGIDHHGSPALQVFLAGPAHHPGQEPIQLAHPRRLGVALHQLADGVVGHRGAADLEALQQGGQQEPHSDGDLLLL